MVLPNSFLRQDYSIALPSASRLRWDLNREYLYEIGKSDWNRIIHQHLGNRDRNFTRGGSKPLSLFKPNELKHHQDYQQYNKNHESALVLGARDTADVYA